MATIQGGVITGTVDSFRSSVPERSIAVDGYRTFTPTEMSPMSGANWTGAQTTATQAGYVSFLGNQSAHYLMRGINSLSAVVYWVSLGYGPDTTAAQWTGGNTPLTSVRAERGPF